MSSKYNRREVLKNLTLGSGAISAGLFSSLTTLEMFEKSFSMNNGNINHSVCRWCFNDIPLNEFSAECVKLGIKAIDLLRPSEWETVKKHGLECSMGTEEFAIIEHGFNDLANHNDLQKNYRKFIDQASKSGVKNIICFSGNRRGMDDKTGIENCAKGLKPLVEYASERNVTLVMELLNSKVDHPDYQCDHTAWGAALSDKLGKPANFRLLFDIYHMQIMEGDIIATIRKYKDYINHFHTAGVPGRNEINETQELFYPAILKAILATGFDGYVAQEFIPTSNNKLGSLKEAVRICDV